MKKILVSIVSTVLLAAVPLFPQSNVQEEASPMKKFQFMIGDWKGSGWLMTRTGKSPADITEKAECKLDCEVIAFQGRGVRRDSVTNTVVVVHDAYGVISFDKKSGKYMVRAYKKEGIVDSELEVIGEKHYRWKFDLPSGGSVRFTMDFSAPNVWKEWGEFSRDGKNWMKTLDMELTRISDK